MFFSNIKLLMCVLMPLKYFSYSRKLVCLMSMSCVMSARSDTNFARGPVWQASTRDTLSYQDRHPTTGYHGPQLRASEAKLGVEHYFLQYFAPQIQGLIGPHDLCRKRVIATPAPQIKGNNVLLPFSTHHRLMDSWTDILMDS